MKKIAVLGAGSWGTALSLVLARKGHQVSLWGRNETKITQINKLRENVPYLPGVLLPEKIQVTVDLDEALADKKYIVLAVPSRRVRGICQIIKDSINKKNIIINAAKGIELETLKRMSEVMEEELEDIDPSIAIISGPSHAEEVGRGIPTAIVVGSRKRKIAEEIQDLFMSPEFRVYTNSDLIGIEYGAALKNVIALGVGIATGVGYGDNAKAALITRGLTEIARLGVAAGANPLTFVGLTGIGDLVVTCGSEYSRNRRAGIQIGKGIPLEHVLQQINMAVEGVSATRAACQLARKYKVSMPISEEIYAVLFRNKNVKEACESLMLRDRKDEAEGLMFPAKRKTTKKK
jgi:glycerol-3-phosphate dehydrogenase (NAD(P)+)